jgi:hypothetical protein
MTPVGPTVEIPVEREMAPETPTVPALLVARETDPEDEEVEKPAVMASSPP